MLIEGHVAALRTEGEWFAAALRGADLTAVVPHCPEWTLGELARHTGRVHRWAACYPRERLARPMDADEQEQAWGPMPDDGALVDWFVEGHAGLVDALRAAPPDVACWSFLPAPSPLAFWARRQAHETAVHRVDTQSTFRRGIAVGRESSIDARFAVDGIDELLLGFYSRTGNRLRLDEPKTLAVESTDEPAYWLVQVGPDGARARRGDVPSLDVDVTVAGPAASLYLGLWNRGPLGDRVSDNDSVVFTGDTALVEWWRAKARVTWS